MSSVRKRSDGRLFFDFYYEGARCRELTNLTDSPENRRRMERVLAVIDAEISRGTFDYARTFPASRRAALFPHPRLPVQQVAAGARPATWAPQANLPAFAEFAGTWKSEKQVEWRVSYRLCIDSILETHLLPAFGTCRLDAIERGQVLQFRGLLASGCQETGGKHGRRKPLVSRTVTSAMGIKEATGRDEAQSYEIPREAP